MSRGARMTARRPERVLDWERLGRRDRQIVDRLVAGESPAHMARDMGIKAAHVRDRIYELGKQLPGDGSPKVRLILWRVRTALEAAGVTAPINIGLPICSGGPMLRVEPHPIAPEPPVSAHPR